MVPLFTSKPMGSPATCPVPVLMALPANSPGIVIVQHMPENFTRAFASPAFTPSLWKSTIFAVLVAVVTTLLGRAHMKRRGW